MADKDDDSSQPAFKAGGDSSRFVLQNSRFNGYQNGVVIEGGSGGVISGNIFNGDVRRTRSENVDAKVHHPPAFCPQHGWFPAKGLAFEGDQDADVAFCQVGCPWCGRPCEVVSGRYEILADKLQILVSASNSPEVLSALRALAEKVQAGSTTLQEAQVQAERIKPGAGKLFDIANWSDQAQATLLAAVVAGMFALGAAKIAAPSGGSTPPPPPPVIEKVIEPVAKRPVVIVKGHPLLTGEIPIPTPRPRRRR